MAKTPEQKWTESIQGYRKKCQQVLNLSKSIRYVGVINKYGRTLTGIIRPGIKPLLKSEDAKNEFFIISNSKVAVDNLIGFLLLRTNIPYLAHFVGISRAGI